MHIYRYTIGYNNYKTVKKVILIILILDTLSRNNKLQIDRFANQFVVF